MADDISLTGNGQHLVTVCDKCACKARAYVNLFQFHFSHGDDLYGNYADAAILSATCQGLWASCSKLLLSNSLYHNLDNIDSIKQNLKG